MEKKLKLLNQFLGSWSLEECKGIVKSQKLRKDEFIPLARYICKCLKEQRLHWDCEMGLANQAKDQIRRRKHVVVQNFGETLRKARKFRKT